jgi:hypothetical protein
MHPIWLWVGLIDSCNLHWSVWVNVMFMTLLPFKVPFYEDIFLLGFLTNGFGPAASGCCHEHDIYSNGSVKITAINQADPQPNRMHGSRAIPVARILQDLHPPRWPSPKRPDRHADQLKTGTWKASQISWVWIRRSLSAKKEVLSTQPAWVRIPTRSTAGLRIGEHASCRDYY